MTTPDTSAVRSWARENGYEVADRGRLRPEVLEAYEAAHRAPAKKAAKPAAKKATKPAAKKAPAVKPAAAPEPEAEQAPARPEPKPKPVADDRRLVALGEQLAALTERVAQLEATVGKSSSGKPTSKTARFRRSK